MGYENPEKIPKYSTYRVQILIDFEWEVEMKKEDVLLRLIAISGELPAGLVGEIVESESYAAALITRLKKENYISVRNAGGYKGYVLRRKGKVIFIPLQKIPFLFSFWICTDQSCEK